MLLRFTLVRLFLLGRAQNIYLIKRQDIIMLIFIRVVVKSKYHDKDIEYADTVPVSLVFLANMTSPADYS